MLTLRKILDSVVIKRKILADAIDDELLKSTSYSTRLAFIEYRDAYNKTDDIASYTFNMNDLSKFTDDPVKLNAMVRDNNYIYTYLNDMEIDELLDAKRKDVLSNYIEYNEYYRVLLGLPKMIAKGGTLVEDESWYIYLPPDVKLQGVDNNIPVHLMTPLQKRTLSSSGELAKLIVKYPRHEYLKYIDKNVSPLDAREANEYDIIYIDISTPEMRAFNDHYRQVRNNFIVNYYQEYDARKYTFYESIQCVNLILAAMANVNAYIPRNQLDSELIDEANIYNLFASYGVPKFKFSISYLQKIAQKLNTLMRKKGTKQVLNEISKTFNEITIFKYFLIKKVKENILDLSIPDKDKYDLFFVKAPVNADDPYEYMKDLDNISTFKEIVEQDPLWGDEGSNLEDEIKGMDFSWTEGKYISINNKIDLVNYTFQMGYFVRYIIEHQKSFKDIKFYIDTASYEASLFELITYLQCLVYRKMEIKPDIPDAMSSTLYIHGIRYNIDFERLKSLLRNHFKYTEYSDDVNIENFILMLEGRRYNIGDVLNAYENNIEIIKKLKSLLRVVDDIDDYKMISYVLKAITYSEKLPEMYDYKTDLEDFLGNYTPNSVKLIQRMDELKQKMSHEKDLTVYNSEISDVINVLRSYINMNKHINMAELLDTTQTLYSDYDLMVYLEQIIDFFKSYTQDFLGQGMEYTIHNVNDGLKILEKLIQILNLDVWDQVTYQNVYIPNSNEKLIHHSRTKHIREKLTCKEYLKHIDIDTGIAKLISRYD